MAEIDTEWFTAMLAAKRLNQLPCSSAYRWATPVLLLRP